MESEYEHRDYSPKTVQDLIDELKKVKDKSKRVAVRGNGDFTWVYENPDLDYVNIIGNR